MRSSSKNLPVALRCARQTTLAAVMALILASGCAAPAADSSEEPAAVDPLASWNEGAAKARIIEFVARVTDPASPDFVPEADRIATFDNDGTLWAEKPLYFQLLFALDRVRALADEHPEWREQQPFRAVLEDDREALAHMDLHALARIVAATHSGMTAEEFSATAREWLDTARHPRFERPFDQLTYQPMLELLDYLRANGFKTFIVSGGGIEFIRTFAPRAYSIPTDQVIGSTAETEFELSGERAFIRRLPEIHFVDDKAGKPVAINRYIGKRPLAAFGNSDGDLQMLQYVTSGDGARLAMIVRHDDSEREYAYDRDSPVGRLDQALDIAGESDWTVVSMRDDWKAIFSW